VLRKLTKWGLMAVAVLTMTGLAVAGEPNMNPGKWEITTKIEMPGMPMKMPAMTTTQCLDKGDYIMKEPPNPTMPSGMKNPCKVTKSEVKGDTVIWDMVCEGQAKTTYHGEITYHGDTMEGIIKISSSSNGGGQPPVTIKLKGKRVGPCSE